MARISHDAKAAVIYREGKSPPVAPKALSSRARAIWKQIVEAKPSGWFDGGNFALLADHCEEQARLEMIWAELRQVMPGSDESKNLTSEFKIVNSAVAASARYLRLTVQETIPQKSMKLSERRSEAKDDDLIGPPARLRKVA
jgi:hypothetical protein